MVNQLIKIVFLCCVSQQSYANDYTIKIKGWDKKEYENSCMNMDDLKLTKFNKTHYSLNGLLTFLRDDIPAEDLKMSIIGYQKFPNGYQPSPLISLEKKDFCDIFRNEKMIVPDVRAASNYTGDECPIPKGSYSITNLMPNPDKLPPTIPGRLWKVSIIMYERDIILSEISIYVEIEHTDPQMQYNF